MKLFSNLFIFIFIFKSSLCFATLCTNWSTPEIIGHLDTKIISEASGLAYSKIISNRLYHNNDSGDGPYFYYTDMAGANTHKIQISDYSPNDVEEIAVGGCLNGQSCIFLADIGDNHEVRASVELLIIQEEKNFLQPVRPIQKLQIKYPDHPHDAEAMFIHPNGDVYIMTKEFSFVTRRAYAAKIFKISKQLLLSSNPVVFEHVGEIDIPWINYNYGLLGQIITGATISEDGKKFAILTYENIIEFNLDISNLLNLNTTNLKEDIDYKIINLRSISPQQEAITYLLGSKSILFSTEAANSNKAEIFKLNCLN